MPNSMTDITNVAPIPRLEITTPVISNPGVTVELDASVSGGGREYTLIYKAILSDCVINFYVAGL